MTTGATLSGNTAETAVPNRPGRFSLDGRQRYLLFVAPSLAVIGAVILFPWLFTIFMSVHDWPIGQRSTASSASATMPSCSRTSASSTR